MSHLHHKVSALIDGELSPNARTRALAHARNCAECRQEIAETLAVKRRINRLAPVEVSADLLDVVGSITVPSEPTVVASRPPLLRRVFAGAGSISAVVIALAYVVGAPQTSQAKTVSPSLEEFAAEFADSGGLAPLSDPAVGVLDADPASAVVSPVAFPTTKLESTWAPPSASATETVGGPLAIRDSGDDRAAVAELGRALAAPAQIGYVGVLVIRSFARGPVDSFRIAVQHVAGQGTRFDVLRANGKVRAESFVKEPAVTTGGPGGDALEALAAAYDLAIDGDERIDGRMATVVSASQQGQVTARFWIDVRTGLLMQRALYADGHLVRWSGFTSFDVNRHGFMPHLPPEIASPETTQLSKAFAPALNDKGWACPGWLNGRFQLSLLTQVDADGGVMRAEYTDGLSRISVFEERGSLDTSALATSSLGDFRAVTVGGHLVYVKVGLPMVAVWESDGTVFTVVTDAPQQLAEKLISRFPHVKEAAEPGVTSRIGDGLSRLASALTP